MADFASSYSALEDRWRQLAAEDDCVYVPNASPAGPVDYIFVTQEPTLTVPGLLDWLRAGGRNFLWSAEDFILHWCVRKCLNKAYHITDISKGAMRTDAANSKRRERWDRWWPM